MIRIEHDFIRNDLYLGVVRAEGVSAQASPDPLATRLPALLERRQADLDVEEETIRRAARDVLRNGRYKPTGRGKPASEYLVRAAGAGTFPRINAPVDVCNYISLKYLVPISLWDLDRAGTDTFRFRLGRAGEAYVFNDGGQQVDLADLVVGCRVQDGADAPIVNPVKDSLTTKTTEATTRVAACLYTPHPAVPEAALEAICDEFAALLAACGPLAETAYAIVAPGETAVV